MLHFWWNLKVSVFWTVVQPPRLVALKVLSPCSPGVMKMILEFQRLIRLVVDHSISSKATSLSRLPVRNDALGDFWIPVHFFVDQPKPTPLMLGMDFLKEQCCVIGKDLIQFPMQSDCWWPLFVSSRGLFSMPLCGQQWEPSSQARRQIVPTGNDGLAFPNGNVHLPDNVNVSENDESADEQVSENLDSCIERSFLSQRHCRLIYQQLRNSDLCFEENFSALIHRK